MSSSAVRMGRAFVEIGADPAKLFKALQQANARIGKFAAGMRSVGTRMMGAGAAMAAPIVAATVAGSRFEDVLLNMRASTGATAQQMDQVRAAALGMSAALGIGPTDAAKGVLELLKAGMSVEQVLGGAGQAAVQFAKVGQMDVAQAAVVMADAMAVFGVGGEQAANTLSAAADASSTDIPAIALAFSQVSAVAGLANQSIGDTAAALAVLANAGVKGSDAGTSLKTMLMRLMAPADDAAEALKSIGLSTESFRGNDGRMRSMVEIIGQLNTAMAGMGQAARDDVFRRIFGQDAIRAAAILTTAGVDGFGAMRQSMDEALPVSAKFNELMSGLSGTATRVFAALERLSVAVAAALGPALVQVGAQIAAVVEGLATFVTENQALIVGATKAAAGVMGVGAASYALGAALGVASGAAGLFISSLGVVIASTVATGAAFIGLITKIAAFKVASIAAAAASAATWMAAYWPVVAVGSWVAILAADMFVLADGVGTVNGVLGSMGGSLFEAAKGFATLKDVGVMAFGEIVESIKAGDIGGAIETAMQAAVAAFRIGASAVMRVVDEWGVNIVNTLDMYIEMLNTPFIGAMKLVPFVGGALVERSYGPGTAESRSLDRLRGLTDRNADRRAAARETVAGLSGMAQGRRDSRSFAAANAAQTQEWSTTAGLVASNLASVRPGPFDDDLAALGAGQPGQFEEWMAGMEARNARERELMAQQQRMASQASSQAEVAGTFSAAAVGGMGFGSSLAQKQVDLLGQIADNTAAMTDGGTVKE